MIYGKRREIRIDSGQRLMKPVPEEEWTITENACPPLIPLELWKKTEARLAQRAAIGQRYNGKKNRQPDGTYYKFALSGLIKCAQCGKTFTIRNTERINPCSHKPYRKPYYGCGGRSQQGYDFCSNQTKLFQEDLEHRVFEVMDEQVLNAGIVEERAQEWQKLIQSEIRKRLAGQPHHRDEIAELDKQIANLINAIAQGIDLAEIRQKLEDMKTRREALKNADASTAALRQRLENGIDMALVKRAVLNSRLALQGKDNLAHIRAELAKYIEGIYVHPNGNVILKAFK